MKVLTVDIETLPPQVYSWTLHNAFIQVPQIIHPGGILGVGYKWHDEKQVRWIQGDTLAADVWDLLDAADVVVGYNSDGFDLKHINRELFLAGYVPPSPYKTVDLWKVNKKKFKFLSGKLDFIVQQAQIGAKAPTGGFGLWVACLEGDERAWAKMARYCKQDVRLTEALYDRMLPWITNHPHVGLFDDLPAHSCPRCGSTNSQRRGRQVAVAVTYARHQCQDCGSWFRSTPLESKAPATRAV